MNDFGTRKKIIIQEESLHLNCDVYMRAFVLRRKKTVWDQATEFVNLS